MKVKCDPEVNILTIELSDSPIDESDHDKPGVILDYDKEGNIVSIEILSASKRVSPTTLSPKTSLSNGWLISLARQKPVDYKKISPCLSTVYKKAVKILYFCA